MTHPAMSEVSQYRKKLELCFGGKMIIYRTRRFEDHLDEYGKRDFLESREEKIRAARTQAEASRVTRPYAGFLVTKSSNFRLIASVEKIGNRSVFIWHEILKRGDQEYKSFSNYSNQILSRLDMDDLRRHVDEAIARELEASRPVPLPDNFLHWLDPIPAISTVGDTSDFVVFETKSWVSDMEGRIADRWPIYELTKSIVDELQDHNVESSDRVHQKESGKFRIYAQKTESKKIFILGLTETQEKVREVIPLPMGEDIRYARRTYPSWLLADEQLWFAIQQKETHNLALSPEEELLLEKAAGQTSDTVVLPMFINGQAGSGKSTMLAYVFAGLVEMWRGQQAGGLPLFVTYNSHLLEKTKETTRKILKARASTRNSLQNDQQDVDDLQRNFLSWHDYLLTKIKFDETARFKKWNRVDYNDFILGWESKGGKLPPLQIPNRNEYSPAMVWYVIRTLIKGSDIDGDLHPDDYQIELTRDEQTVSKEDYRKIFESYYSAWYQPALRNNGLWDDQDLTFEALKAVEDALEPSEISALVVDEAQDFTRRELRLITRATVFSSYEIPPMGRGVRPPIILAGDPLQTLSPTGFRWSAVKAGIYEELRGLFGNDARDPFFTELMKNYRSVEPIVKLANSIQLWRSHLFGLSEIRPQEAWSPEEDVSGPERFSLDQIDEDEFIRFAADTVLIVPCEEGGEIEYVRSDPVLSRMFPDASEKNPPATVFSAASIKGLEYEKVLLFKFGESAIGIDWGAREEDERDLVSEYFFNKLYVAATRATHHLYVVDTAEGDDALWSHFSGDSISHLVKVSEKRHNQSFTLDHVSGIEYGASDLSGVQEQNPRQNAEKTKAYALETGSARKMRQAASNFRRANDRREATECEALALKFEGDLISAGKKFVESRNHDEAWRCLWDCQAWSELDSIDTKADVASSAERAAVAFMVVENPTINQVVQFCEEMVSRSDRRLFQGETWSIVAKELSNHIASLKKPVEPDKSGCLPGALEILWEAGHLEVAKVAVDLFMEDGNLMKARRILERLDPTHPDVALRLFEIDGSPGGLRHLRRAKLNDKIRQHWNDSGQPYDSEWLTYLLPALEGNEFVIDRLSVLIEVGDLPTAKGEFLAQSSLNRETAEILSRIVQVLVDQGQIGEAVEFVDEACEITGSPQRGIVYQRLLVSIASSFEKRKWEIPERELRELRELCPNLFNILAGGRGKFDRLSPENVPAIGAVFEVAGRFNWAAKVYLLCIDSRELKLRDYCRRRALLMATEQLKDVKLRGTDRAKIQQEQQSNSASWNIELDQRGMVRLIAIDESEETAEDPHPSGKIGSVQWFTADGTDLMVNIVENGLFEGASVSLVGGTHQPSQNILIAEGSPESVSLRAGDLEVLVGLGQEVRISIYRKDVLVGAMLVYRRSGKLSSRPAPTRRTRALVQAEGTSRATSQRGNGTARKIAVYELANELGVQTKEVLSVARSVGALVRRGDSKLSPEDAERIRRAHARRMGSD